MNLQALAAMDDCEHATGKTLEAHRLVPKEIIADALNDAAMGNIEDNVLKEKAGFLIADLRKAGYAIVQVVQTGNKPFP